MTPALKTTDTAVLTAFAAQVEALQDAPVLRPNDHLAAWRAAYASEGLPVGKSRQEAESLRRLEAVGLVTAGPGATMGRKFKLTLAGAVNAATRFEKNDADHLRKMLTDVLTCLDATDTTVPRSDVPILLGCEVVESAGGWWELASKSDENWRNYQNDLARANGWLWPLLALPPLLTGRNRRHCRLCRKMRLIRFGIVPMVTRWPDTRHPALLRFKAWWSGIFQHRAGIEFSPSGDVPAETHKPEIRRGGSHGRNHSRCTSTSVRFKTL